MGRMNPHRSNPAQKRKLARLIAAAWLTLAWIGAALFTDTLRIDRRHIRRRYYWLNLDRIARVIACLVVSRAGAMMPSVNRPPVRDFTGSGFKRRLRRTRMLRAFFGSKLRKALKHPDIARRYARLVRALLDIDALARRIVRRLKRGLSRLRPILPLRPPHHRVRSLGAPAALAHIDSS